MKIQPVPAASENVVVRAKAPDTIFPKIQIHVYLMLTVIPTINLAGIVIQLVPHVTDLKQHLIVVPMVGLTHLRKAALAAEQLSIKAVKIFMNVTMKKHLLPVKLKEKVLSSNVPMKPATDMVNVHNFPITHLTHENSDIKISEFFYSSANVIFL